MDLSHLTDAELEKMAGGGGDSHAHDVSKLSDAELEHLANPPGLLESGLRGLAQGASLGFADEITGAGEHLLTGKPYDQARDESRANYAAAHDANPTTYTAGQVGGGLATGLVGGAPATLGRAAIMGAGVGGLAGVGGSEAHDALGVTKDGLTGAAIGGIGGAALSKLSALGNGVKNTLEDVATAPLGAQAERGLAAGALDKIHQAGAGGNAMIDKLMPATGNAATDKVVAGLSKIGRYGLAGKAQGALDAMEQFPKAAQWGAGKMLPAMESFANSGVAKAATGTQAANGGLQGFLMQSPKFQALAQKNPKAFDALSADLGKRVGGYTPEKIPVPEEQSKQSFLEGN